ncbi:MAG: HAMP domain-containing histidine kinase [Bacteroidetes bacterium]|nr:HAMP domain-containing histidine kinase [Bacteroidota bacterium]
MRTQTKVALLIGLVCVTIVVIFSITVYFFVNKYSYVDFYKRLEARVRIASQYYLEPGSLKAENVKALKDQHLEKLENEKEFLIELNQKTSITSIINEYKFPSEFVTELLNTGKATEKEGNLFYAGAKHLKNEKVFLIIVSAENYYVSHHLLFLRNLLIAGISFVVILVISLSFYFSRHIFSPIRHIIDKVKQISTENIHLRLDDSNTNSEIKELILTFNDLLNRIETAFETHKNFISNASHELGTPLTSIIGEADVSLLKPRSPEEYIESLKNISFQAERLDNITKSLLFLAQTGYKDKAITLERIRIDEVIWDTKQVIDKLNPDNKITVDLSLLPEDPKKLKIKGNRQLLQLAFANLLNNACKYSNNKQVTVFIASSDSQIIVTIKDLGIGIPESEIPFIYDPFFRASNTKLYEGYGIGLPLTRNVIKLHQGQLIVNSVLNAGTTVQVKIPLYLQS